MSTRTSGSTASEARPERSEFLGSLALINEPVCVPLARTFVRIVLDAFGYGANADEVTLMASELVTNAVVHSRHQPHSQIDVFLHVKGSVLHLEVHDREERPAVTRPVKPDDESGRGLSIVEALAADWGAYPTPTGKCVWFEVDVQTKDDQSC